MNSGAIKMLQVQPNRISVQPKKRSRAYDARECNEFMDTWQNRSFTHQHVYELRHVGNGELGNATFVMPALCLSVAVQQLVDERRHVGDGHPTVAVDVE